MAQYTKYNSYNFDRFEPKIVTTSSAAPEIRRTPEKKPQLKLVEKTKRTAAQIQQETNVATKKAVKIFAVAVAILLFMSMAIYSRVQLDEINREISSVENKMELAESDTIRLNNELNAMVSINNVEDFAANKLGMVKVQDYQVVYVDLSTDDQVVMANGEATVINETDE